MTRMTLYVPDVVTENLGGETKNTKNEEVSIMAQITVYVPDDVAEKAREYKDEIVFSQVFTRGLKETIAAIEARKRSPVPDDDLTATIERLAHQRKATDKVRQEEAYEDGWTWAKEAEYLQIERLLEAISPEGDIRIEPTTIGELSIGIPLLSSHEEFVDSVMHEVARRTGRPHQVMENRDYRRNFRRGVEALLAAVRDKI